MKRILYIFYFLAVSWGFCAGHDLLFAFVLESDHMISEMIDDLIDPFWIDGDIVFGMIIYFLWLLFALPYSFAIHNIFPARSSSPVKVTGRVQMVPRKESPQAVN